MWQTRERATNKPPDQTLNSLNMQFTKTNKSRASISMSLNALNGENNIRIAQCSDYERYLQKQITEQETWTKNNDEIRHELKKRRIKY